MTWRIFTGEAPPADGTDAEHAGEGVTATNQKAWCRLPAPPPWRERTVAIRKFVITDDLLDAVNAALHLRRPLLLTGSPGSGKSTLVSLIAAELDLGAPLNWYITSRSTLPDALFQYDALGRLHATQTADEQSAGRVEDFVTLGPLGTALASREQPRAVLIDEIDKSDFDLPSDLLNVLEEGEFSIPPLVRDIANAHTVRGADQAKYQIANGIVQRTHWPVIVMTSNGERTFPPPFLRRCVRFDMPMPTQAHLEDVVSAYLGTIDEETKTTVAGFAARLIEGQQLAIDQLLNYLHLLGAGDGVEEAVRTRLGKTVLAELNSR